MENNFIENPSNDLTALNQLVDDYTNKETELMKVERELVTRDETFASFITTQKRLAEQKQVLTDMIKEFMTEHNMMEHETDTVSLKLSPSGKYRVKEGLDINEDVPDEFCDIKKTINNKKVKAYFELNNSLPEQIESTGSVLRIKVKMDV